MPKLCRTALKAIGCTLGLSAVGWGFTQVTISTAAPAGLEESFIAATTEQFMATVTKNPLAVHTYGMKLFGPNPFYQAPAPPPSTLEQALSLGATVYVYGFGNGMTYQNHVSEDLTMTLFQLCPSATNFVLIQTSTATFDNGTCHDVLSTLLRQFFDLELSTPTPIPSQI